MAGDWTHIRVRPDTLDRLEEYRGSLYRLAEVGLGPELPESGKPGGGPAPADWVINRLLDLVDRHRERAAAQRGRRRRKRFPRGWDCLG